MTSNPASVGGQTYGSHPCFDEHQPGCGCPDPVSPPASVGPAPDGLLPCPFCGGGARIVKTWVPRAKERIACCANQECLGHQEEQDEQGGWAVSFQSDADAIAAWNTRAPHPDREAEPAGGVELVCRVGWEEARRLSLADGEEDSGPWPPVAGAFGWQEDDSEMVRETERAKAKAILSALSVSPPVVEGSLRASPCVPTERVADLCSRLDAIVTEEDQFHPVGCSTWWEEARVAVDMAKDFICRHQAQPTEGHEAAVVADDRLLWFLRVIDGAGGEALAGDGYNVLGAFCDDRGDRDDDTYNLSESRGWTRTVHSGWGDGCATVEITDAGRAVLWDAEGKMRRAPKDRHQPTTPGEQDIEDTISDAIGDSMDMDWTYRDGARAIMRAFEREGWTISARPGEQGEEG